MKEIITQKLTKPSAQKEELLTRPNTVIDAQQEWKNMLDKIAGLV